jgi:hypothetical protein
MGDEKTEALVVPRKSGNSPHEDPMEGRRRPEHGTERGNDV